jgi:DNA-binding LytR/AlgR family response regulator
VTGGKLAPPRWGPYGDRAGWLRGFAICVVAAVFMAIVGAFGSGRLPLPVRLVYWMALILLGWLWGAVLARRVFRRPSASGGLWWRVLVVSLALSAPLTLVVAYASRLAYHARFALADLPQLFLSVLVVSLALTTLNVLVDRSPAVTTADAAAPKFLDRLPLKLRGAEVWAVEAEDHYLRLHTSKGQDLILMRLSDAVAELEGIEGAQAHRSWWVARDAIADARRGDGRATLTLKDGSQVPVSRTYARVLRERGWI